MDHKVSLFIPVYNGADLIRKNLKRCYSALLQLNDNFEIIVVDDNSSDASERFKQLINRTRNSAGRDLKYISYTRGPSRRENLAKSFPLARYGILAFIDADLSCDAAYLMKAVDLLEKASADIVIGSRYIKGAKAKRGPVRRVLAFLYNHLIRVIFRSKIMDHQCGLKVFRKDSAMPIIDEMGYDERFIRGWFWDAEFLVRAQRRGLKIIEMPVEWLEADSTTFEFRRELRCVRAIVGLKRELDRKERRGRSPDDRGN